MKRGPKPDFRAMEQITAAGRGALRASHNQRKLVQLMVVVTRFRLDPRESLIGRAQKKIRREGRHPCRVFAAICCAMIQ